MVEKTCFVIGPIGAENSEIRRHADWLLEGIITPVVTEFGFRIVRADKIATPGMIDSQVINHVIDAELVVADLSNWNPNVFYELGLRHMAEGAVIHMIDRANEEIPFDVKPYRTILFGWASFNEFEQSKEDLRAQVREVLDETHAVDNPVIRARGQIKLRETASPKEQEILSMIEDLRSQVRGLEAARMVEREEAVRVLTVAEAMARMAEADRKVGGPVGTYGQGRTFTGSGVLLGGTGTSLTGAGLLTGAGTPGLGSPPVLVGAGLGSRTTHTPPVEGGSTGLGGGFAEDRPKPKE